MLTSPADVPPLSLFIHSAMFQLNPLKIDVKDFDLQRQLTLSTADLRFADYLVQQVLDEQGNIRTDDTGKDPTESSEVSYLINR